MHGLQQAPVHIHGEELLTFVTHIVVPHELVELVTLFFHQLIKSDRDIQFMVEHIHAPLRLFEHRHEDAFRTGHMGVRNIKTEPADELHPAAFFFPLLIIFFVRFPVNPVFCRVHSFFCFFPRLGSCYRKIYKFGNPARILPAFLGHAKPRGFYNILRGLFYYPNRELGTVVRMILHELINIKILLKRNILRHPFLSPPNQCTLPRIIHNRTPIRLLMLNDKLHPLVRLHLHHTLLLLDIYDAI